MLAFTFWAVQQGFGLSILTGEARRGVESVLGGQNEGGAGVTTQDETKENDSSEGKGASGDPGEAPATGESRDDSGRSGGGVEKALYVPDLAGQTVEIARQTLESTGFRVSRVVEEPGDSPEGVVLRTDPPSGSALEPGSGVAIVASSGTHAGGSPGGGDDYSGSGDPGGSDPEGGDPGGSDPGDGGLGQAPDEEEAVTVPDVAGRQSGQAVTILESAGLRAEVRGAFGDMDSGTVISSDPPAGSRVEEGTTVTLTVFDESGSSSAAEEGEGEEQDYPDQYKEE